MDKESLLQINALLQKEEAQDTDCRDAATRRIAVEWILRATNSNGLTTSTAILAVNYLDRFARWSKNGKPCLARLTAVACLSIAAKIEEEKPPLPIDHQVNPKSPNDGLGKPLFQREDAGLFEPETVRKMEIAVLSALDWKMRPVTALKLLHCFIAGFKLNKILSVEVSRRCEDVLIAMLPDNRFTRFAPSILAASAMCHVVNGKGKRGSEFDSQLMGTLKIEQRQCEECLSLIGQLFSNERKLVTAEPPRTPDGVVDMSFNGDDEDESADLSSSPSTWKRIKTNVADSDMDLI